MLLYFMSISLSLGCSYPLSCSKLAFLLSCDIFLNITMSPKNNKNQFSNARAANVAAIWIVIEPAFERVFKIWPKSTAMNSKNYFYIKKITAID